MRQSDKRSGAGMARRLLPAALALLLACLAHAKDPAYRGTAHTAGSDATGTAARGTVFLDANRNSMLDAGEPGIAGVLVSNARGGSKRRRWALRDTGLR